LAKTYSEKTYIRNDQSAIINVRVDKSKMKNFGLYTTKISATRDDGSAFPEFDMLATIVIPYEFNSSNNYKMNWKDEVVNAGMIKRYFIQIPAGQNTMKVVLSRDPSLKNIQGADIIYTTMMGFRLMFLLSYLLQTTMRKLKTYTMI